MLAYLLPKIRELQHGILLMLKYSHVGFPQFMVDRNARAWKNQIMYISREHFKKTSKERPNNIVYIAEVP